MHLDDQQIPGSNMDGRAGFRGAPVSKGIVLLSAASSLLRLTGVLKPHRRPPKALLLFTFPHVGALIFGLALLYQSRNLERHAGSSKHAALVGMSLALHVLLLLGSSAGNGPSGPLPLIFASQALFTLETPAMQQFTLFGVRLTDKVGLHAFYMDCPAWASSGLGQAGHSVQPDRHHPAWGRQDTVCNLIGIRECCICRCLCKQRVRSCCSRPHAAHGRPCWQG